MTRRAVLAGGAAGAPPFVLAGADGGVLCWERDPASADDPQRMVTDEMPRWLGARGLDARRPVAWGWSMGGDGVLRAFSPDVTHSPSVVTGDCVYRATPLGVCCGRSDPLYGDVRGFVARLPRPPQVLSYGDGAHARAYWDSVTLPAFAFLGGALQNGGAA